MGMSLAVWRGGLLALLEYSLVLYPGPHPRQAACLVESQGIAAHRKQFVISWRGGAPGVRDWSARMSRFQPRPSPCAEPPVYGSVSVTPWSSFYNLP